MVDFNQRLRQLRKEKGLKQHELAKFLDMSPTGYNKYETGAVEPGIQTLLKLAQFFNVSVDYLIGYTDDRNNTEVFDMYKKLDEFDKILFSNLLARFIKNKK